MDAIATAPDGRRIVIRCKRYGSAYKAGGPDMQRFAGTCRTVHGTQVRLYDADVPAGWASRTGPAPWT